MAPRPTLHLRLPVLFFYFLGFLAFNLQAQELKSFKPGASIVYKPAAAQSTASFLEELNQLGSQASTLSTQGKDISITWTTLRERESNGMRHLRLEQKVEGLRVIGAQMTVHDKDGMLAHAVGRAYAKQDVLATPKLDEAEAAALA